MKRISGWGNHPHREADIASFRYEEELQQQLRQLESSSLARGMGRAYGDSATNEQVISTLNFDRIRAFDEESGVITCEAGLTLDSLLPILIPRGWFVPVTPGTRFVSIGGMLASDVHGKNHHVDGCFSRHVEAFTLMRGDGEIIECTRQNTPLLFSATCGGMGLTGIILSVRFRLIRIESAWIDQTTDMAPNLDSVLEKFEATSSARYSVAWIDCLARGQSLGRSVLYTGDHANRKLLPRAAKNDPLSLSIGRTMTVPFHFPAVTLNSFSVRAFNTLYYNKARWSPAHTVTDLYSFFYPLDGLQHWNRIYGKPGFLQYQCVIPQAAGCATLRQLLTLISQSGRGSFLAVLKLLGAESDGLIGFPMPGYTLALDFPNSKGLEVLLQALDDRVLAAGGRIYLTKDARMSASMARDSYPRWDDFRSARQEIPGALKFSSDQSRRLLL